MNAPTQFSLCFFSMISATFDIKGVSKACLQFKHATFDTLDVVKTVRFPCELQGKRATAHIALAIAIAKTMTFDTSQRFQIPCKNQWKMHVKGVSKVCQKSLLTCVKDLSKMCQNTSLKYAGVGHNGRSPSTTHRLNQSHTHTHTVLVRVLGNRTCICTNTWG